MTVSSVASEKPNDISLSLYRAIWRWHFFAGLLVIPFMLNLAVTGSLYLFKDEIDNTAFAYRNVVQPRGEALAPSLWLIMPRQRYLARKIALSCSRNANAIGSRYRWHR